ncbi:hypothetical protein ISG33_14285 [Glaciecola sp. MH2013]|uniref:hypothetical protein n=1 Tax=Glaciecola sp. MH2013 TaxID=2785524 RepID=UPI00189E2201|nr:hypothetical protein [Glaciecola sp. MH2013]MBF7074570.1 hypothetical protein [Glaciecola sp. MH2013]
MKIVVLSVLSFLLMACASNDEGISPFTFSEQEISRIQNGYINRDESVFPFILVADGGPNGSISMEKPNSGNLNYLRNYGVVYLAIVNERGRVIHKKLIAGQRNMRGNNAVFFNQIISNIPFNREGENQNREMVVPIALTYPLETY